MLNGRIFNSWCILSGISAIYDGKTSKTTIEQGGILRET